MGAKSISAEIRTNKSLEEVKTAAKETFRALGGVLQDTPFGFQIEDGGAGINFSFVAKINGAIAIKQQSPGLYRIEAMIVWNPNPLVWICLFIGFFFLWFLWIIAALYLFVDPAPVYSRLISQTERLLQL